MFQANHFIQRHAGLLPRPRYRYDGGPTTVDTSPSQLRSIHRSPIRTPTSSRHSSLWIENSRPQAALALGENLGDWFNLLNNWSSVAGHDKLRKTATFDSDTHFDGDRAKPVGRETWSPIRPDRSRPSIR